MQPQASSRIDLFELRTQIVKKVGDERSKKYFYCLNRFLSQKLNKSEFDRLCFRLLGRENLPLHNQLIRSILKNAHHARVPPQISKVGPTNSLIQTSKVSPLSREDGHEHSGIVVANQKQSTPDLPNGLLSASPRKVRSGMRDRKLRDRPSLLGPNGRVDSLFHQSTAIEDGSSKVSMENGELLPCDYQKLLPNHQVLAEQPMEVNDFSVQQHTNKLRSHDKDHSLFVEVEEEVEQANHFRSPLIAPLGIPYCRASVGGAQKNVLVAGSSNLVSYIDGLSDTETLRKRMEQIANVQDLGGVSLECANTLNNMLDLYLKRLIRSCVELVGARSELDPRRHIIHKQQAAGKVINGIYPHSHLHTQSGIGNVGRMQGQGLHTSISLLDFKVAMELNPQQLGEDWPLLLENICMRAFGE